MAAVLRGDIRWAILDPVVGREQAGLRPVLILSTREFNQASQIVIAMALTSQEPRAGFPLTMECRAAGLPKKSWIKISQVRTLSVDRLRGNLARLPAPEVDAAVQALGLLLLP